MKYRDIQRYTALSDSIIISLHTSGQISYFFIPKLFWIWSPINVNEMFCRVIQHNISHVEL